MTENTSHRIMIVAGEASGDLHGAGLVREALRRDPTLSFFGIGGPRMREAGVETLVDSAEMAVIGIVEVLAHFGVISRAFMTLRRVIAANPPDLLILIDYPDFNMLLARVARRHGVKVLYYISPQVWAWRTGRVKTIGRLVDRMAVVFPFEVPFYERAGVPVSFVGHPLADRVRPTMGRDEALASFGLDPGRRVVGLFPGSRRGEIAKLFPVILESAQLLRERYPGIQFILPLASSLTDGDIAPQLSASGLDVTVARDRVYDVMQVCDAIITVSGTVTLEIALMGVPMVIIYKVSPLTYQVGKRLIRVDHIGICNIVAGTRVVPELIQDEASADRIAAEIGRYLDDSAYAEKTRAGLAMVKEKLGTGGCSERVAGIVLEMLGKQV
ncbi:MULTISPECIES: lipid-A-disaccharide synthase [Geobacter]|uniref:lipid-A-disaccharide synthase n=1 Tax=Geobacter TaxID=28231 RepID=UPI0025727B5C|nr:lipid-A-disaccharide synthase [Geobacter sulfurreducens]HML78884.1 lipid-A-disaccharide synthase [Geobacter sulfurreducens]